MVNQNIIVLGSKGMLGSQVLTYFKKKNFSIYTFDKKFNQSNVNRYIKNLNERDPSVIINCIGKIKQKKPSLKKLFWSNTILTNKFAKLLNSKHILVHPSTDCVFKGKKKIYYNKNSKLDATDAYGLSKILAEKNLKRRPNTLIIRTSIVGLEIKTNKGLLSWFLKQSKNVYGYTDHFWNGITTLRWCEFLDTFLFNKKKNNFKKAKIVQIATREKYSKYEILKIFKKVFKKKILIKKKRVGYINRCLKSDFKIDNFYNQVKNLREFNKS